MSEPGESMASEQALTELQSPEPEARVRAIRQLRAIGGPQAVAAIMGALDDPVAGVRSSAALTLGLMKAREAVPALIERLSRDEGDHVRAMCAVALERLGDERAADALLQALADPDRRVLSAAGTGLVRLGDRRAIPPLLRLLDHADRSVRYGVCRDLLNLKAGDQRLVDALERLSQDPEAEEHDLEADEWNCDLEKHRQMAREEGWPEPRPRLRMHELVEQARQLLAQSES